MTRTKPDLDAVVIGTGFSGIYMLHKLRNELGLSVRAYERGDGVGGTWHWNRYPGAMSDVESIVYRYSFDREMLQEWPLTARYTSQPDMLAYLQAVVDRHDLGRDIQLRTNIASAVFDEADELWTVTADGGESVTARYLVGALGVLSRANEPDIPGREDFRGQVVHTGRWPADLSIEGKRVGVIGTGSTGTQFICAAARTARHLTVFQRSAQYVVPSGYRPVDDAEVAATRAAYDRIWADVRGSRVACGFVESDVPAMSVSAEERTRRFQESWDAGNGFRFMFGTFGDIAADPDANEAACEFIRSKITEIVRDPETARRLRPTQPYAKRPICNLDYYETYNRDNVSLVSIPENPIVEMTADGVRTADGVVHELDVLVLATGFEAVDGSYRQMEIRGRTGETVQQHWQDGPVSYLGMAMTGFPNMFMVLGPNSAFSNLPPCIETQVEWITELVARAERDGAAPVEVVPGVEQAWTAVCQEIADHTMFSGTDSWIFGSNVPDKKRSVLFFFGGLAAYRAKLAEVAAADYAGFELHPGSSPKSRALTSAQ